MDRTGGRGLRLCPLVVSTNLDYTLAAKDLKQWGLQSPTVSRHRFGTSCCTNGGP